MPGETQITLPAVDVAERTDPGRDPTKQVNEDAFGHRETPFGVLAVVCDGMGGHVGGREASTAALATIFEGFERAPLGTPPREVLRDAIRLANVRVRGLAMSDPGGGRPGSTVVAVLVHAGGTEVAHVGDSRVYLVQQGQIFQITRDHSMVQEMVEAKILTPDQAAVHPDANKITRALGIDDDVQVEVRLQPIAHVAGDAFILCSDGLSDLVEAHEMLSVVAADPPAQAVGKLVDLANARGGYDNVTVVVVKPRTSAPASSQSVAETIVDSPMTLRPPARAPFAPSVESVLPQPPPASPPAAASSASPAPASIPAAPPSRRQAPSPTVGIRGRVAVALAAVLVVGAALVWLRSLSKGAARSASSSAGAPAAVDASLPQVFGTAPTASVNLVPATLPMPAAIDAAGIAPLEPVPSAPVRHSRGKARP
jgi:protein phosphatase